MGGARAFLPTREVMRGAHRRDVAQIIGPCDEMRLTLHCTTVPSERPRALHVCWFMNLSDNARNVRVILADQLRRFYAELLARVSGDREQFFERVLAAAAERKRAQEAARAGERHEPAS